MQANSDAVAPPYLGGILLTVVVVAALASLAVIQEARQTGEVLDLVEVRPRTITAYPGAREARIEWRQRRTSDDAVVRIVDSADDPVRTLLDGGTLEGDDAQQVFRWNGEADSVHGGVFAEPGRYRVEILLRDLEREIVPEQSEIRLRAPRITDKSLPEGDR